MTATTGQEEEDDNSAGLDSGLDSAPHTCLDHHLHHHSHYWDWGTGALLHSDSTLERVSLTSSSFLRESSAFSSLWLNSRGGQLDIIIIFIIEGVLSLLLHSDSTLERVSLTSSSSSSLRESSAYYFTLTQLYMTSHLPFYLWVESAL